MKSLIFMKGFCFALRLCEEWFSHKAVFSPLCAKFKSVDVPDKSFYDSNMQRAKQILRSEVRYFLHVSVSA